MEYYLLVILSVLAASVAQMLLKHAARQEYDNVLRQYLNVWVILGYLIMLACMLLNIFCMSHGVQAKEVSIIESMSYLFVPVLSFFVFGERHTTRQIWAMAIIVIGIVVFFL